MPIGTRLLTLTNLSLYWWGSDLITATFIDSQYFSFSFPFLVAIVTPESERVAKHYSINIGDVNEQIANYFRSAVHSIMPLTSATNSSVLITATKRLFTAVVAF